MRTVDVATPDGVVAVDTGFIVFNDRTYPWFTRLLERLAVASRDTEMSFSVRCDRTGLEYNGTSLNGVFADRRHLVSPPFLGMIRDILRFNRHGADQAARAGDASVRGFLDAHRYGCRFRDHYLLPMGAAIWSCPTGTFLEFPIAFVMTFFANHGLLQVTDRPVWKVVRGGSARYVEALVARSPADFRLRTPVHGIRRGAVTWRSAAAGVERSTGGAGLHATGSAALDDPSLPAEVLGAVSYSANTPSPHRCRWLASRRRRGSWNYRSRPMPRRGR